MSRKEISEDAIIEVANLINTKLNRTPNVHPQTVENDSGTPQYFEIVPFDEIDESDRTFFAIDGSYNFQEFFNGVCIGVYTAGYVAYHKGSRVRVKCCGNDFIAFLVFPSFP